MGEEIPTRAEPTIGLVLADPFAVFRLGARAIVDDVSKFEVSEVASLEELAQLLASGPAPDLALVDLDLPPSGAAEAVTLLRRHDAIPIVWANRSRLSPELVFRLVQAGAMGVLTKEITSAGLVRALRGATGGQAALGREIAQLLIRGMQEAGVGARGPRRVTALSSRELEVLELVAEGHANKQIAQELRLSEFTVKRHIQNILRKTGVHSRWEASASYLSLRREAPAPRPLVLSGRTRDSGD